MTCHVSQVLSHKDITSQDKQLYIYNVKFEKNGKPWKFEVSLKNKFYFLMTLIELVH